MSNTNDLVTQLDAFHPADRQDALRRLIAAQSPGSRPTGGNVNMHLHSFFSYNARGYSPSRLAWEARQAGLYAAGLCDFDVLDGMDEFLEAGLDLGLRTAVNLETRAYLQEFAESEISSPGEPGVTYIMGAGFTRLYPVGSPQANTLRSLRDQAAERNRALVRRINPHMGAAAIDYETDVVPLSPGGCPTERHIIRAYVTKARGVAGSDSAAAEYWSRLLGKPVAEIAALLGKGAAMEERVRAKLAKQGGLGYEPPTPKTFPPTDDFVQWVLSCEAVPMATWLDGTSKGESDAMALLECLHAKGVAAVNIIPDRNWNIADAAARGVKTARLREFVQAAQALRLPINIGTEMNRDGLPFVDDLDGEALRPYRQAFIEGAQAFVGHTLLARLAGFSYVGAAATAEFGRDTAAKNRFFASVGALSPLDRPTVQRLLATTPEQRLASIRDSARRGQWQVKG